MPLAESAFPFHMKLATKKLGSTSQAQVASHLRAIMRLLTFAPVLDIHILTLPKMNGSRTAQATWAESVVSKTSSVAQCSAPSTKVRRAHV